MLLSSVSFVKNCQFSDYIIGKIKEDQDKRDRKELKKVSRRDKKTDVNSNEIPDKNQPKVSQMEKCEVVEDVPLPDPVAEPATPASPLVSIETFDGYRLTADTVYDKLTLMEEPDQSENCHFRKTVLDTQGDEQKQLFVTFNVESDPSCFMIATSAGCLVLKDFGELPVDSKNPDERCFLLHESNGGLASLQPFGKRGHYVHHFDEMLSVQKLEINWRPPEEYLFRIDVIPEVEPTNQIQCETRLPCSTGAEQNGECCEQSDLNKPSESMKSSSSCNFKDKRDKIKTGLIKACFGWPKKKHGADSKVKTHFT